ncbi:MAG: pantetheine-phosphate adenylyltransferase [Myxococcales bacterium]|nr:pantetheine-phosphate adenylyltransferase [Myxococcales bacterium]
MSASPQRHALFPGTFDPFTLGHLDLVTRAAALFDRVTVAVASHPSKTELLSADTRRALIEESIVGLANVRCALVAGLVVDACRDLGCQVIVRGARSGTDFDYEVQMATTNRLLTGVETIVLSPGTERAHISSTLVRQIAGLGGDVSGFVPPPVLEALHRCFPES